MGEDGSRKLVFSDLKTLGTYLTGKGISFRSFDSGRIIVCKNGDVYRFYQRGFYKKVVFSMNCEGYYQFSVSMNGSLKTYHPHRLVAELFIDNPDNLPVVNHKNLDRTDNSVENLEWCTHKGNSVHSTKYQQNKKRTVLKRMRETKLITTDIIDYINSHCGPQPIMSLQRYRAIENGIVSPKETEALLIEEYCGIPIATLLKEDEYQ